jgi:hypothetical protein
MGMNARRGFHDYKHDRSDYGPAQHAARGRVVVCVGVHNFSVMRVRV